MTANGPSRATLPRSTTNTHIRADHQIIKRVGAWTTSRSIDVSARRSKVLLDLRDLGEQDADIQLGIDTEHSVLILLVRADDNVDTSGVTWTGRGTVKDRQPSANTGTRVVVHGAVHDGQIRIYRDGLATFISMFDRRHLRAMHHDHLQTKATTRRAP
jgi:hypothetical protein